MRRIVISVGKIALKGSTVDDRAVFEQRLRVELGKSLARPDIAGAIVARGDCVATRVATAPARGESGSGRVGAAVAHAIVSGSKP